MMAIKMTAMVVRPFADWRVAATGFRIRVRNVTIEIKPTRTGARMHANSLSAVMVFVAWTSCWGCLVTRLVTMVTLTTTTAAWGAVCSHAAVTASPVKVSKGAMTPTLMIRMLA
jgi:hypothetical protein